MSLTTSTLRNATDATVVEAKPNRNTTTSTRLTVSGVASNNKFAFIHFARPVPLGSTVLSATLTLYMEAPDTGTKTLSLKKVTEKWKAGQVTFATKPAVSASDVKTVTMATGTTPQEIVFDVKTHLQAVADGTAWYGWRVEMTTSLERVIASSEASGHKPRLEVTYGFKPSKPTGLAPGGGNAVSVSKPLLRFNDVQALQSIQVQINTTNSFTGLVSFDSGTVNTVVPNYDLSTSAFGGITNGQTFYWRVRVKDDGGVWSDWSDATSFTRATVPTLTLLTPTGNFVDESTPTISWSFTGTTQRAWQVLVKDTEGKTLSDSGQQGGTTTSYEIPVKVIKTNNDTYKIVVRVWDNIARDGADTAWFAVSTNVTYRYSNTVAPVTSLVATSLEPKPGVRLTWNRTTAPDQFNIRKGNALIATVNAADVLVSGTSYAYTDYTAQPNRSQRWTIEAVVNGVTSDLNPLTAFVKPNNVGIWVTDPTDGTQVQLLDTDEGSWEMGEISAVFAPVGSNRSFKVTQALRGYEGSISGIIAETEMTAPKTTAEQEADMWKIKSNPNRTFILTLSDITLPVVLGNIVVSPSPLREIIRNVSFDFWQVDDVPFKANL